MNFNIEVKADASSWPNGKISSPGLRVVSGGWHANTIDFPKMLHLIGYLTTPTSSTGHSLAEYWAQIRYLHAIDISKNELLLSDEYSDIDPHQKTILSDDFGVGLSMSWLEGALNLDISKACDGYYFTKILKGWLGSRVGPRKNKRGPLKTPDFVIPDFSGNWHVIECKGTQSGDQARMNQLISTGRNGNPSGGTVQKTTIIFPPNVAGERLAAGVKIAQSGSGEKTNLLIMDPVEEPILKLEDVDMSTAFDPVYRAAAAKSLLLSGAQSAAVEVASPRALVELSDEIQTDDKVDFLAKRRNIAEAEQTRLKPETRQRSDGTKELFREMTTALSQPLHWASRTYSKAIVQYSCSWDLVEAALDMRTSEGPFSDNDKYWSKATSGMKFSTDLPERDEKGPISASAELSLGKTFTVRLTLE